MNNWTPLITLTNSSVLLIITVLKLVSDHQKTTTEDKSSTTISTVKSRDKLDSFVPWLNIGALLLAIVGINLLLFNHSSDTANRSDVGSAALYLAVLVVAYRSP